MTSEHTVEHPLRRSEPTGSRGPSGLAYRYLRDDNKHIWLSCCVAASISVFPLSTLIARRIPRLATSAWARETWADKGSISTLMQASTALGAITYSFTRQRQYKKTAETDEDIRTITLATDAVGYGFQRQSPELLRLLLLQRNGASGPAELEKPTNNIIESEEPANIIERSVMAAAKLWTSSTPLWIVRKGLEDDLRNHGVPRRDIERVVVLLGGAPDFEKHLGLYVLTVLALTLGYTWPMLTKRPRPKWLGFGAIPWVGMWGMYGVAHFQHEWLALHVENRSAVATVLRKRRLTQA